MFGKKDNPSGPPEQAASTSSTGLSGDTTIKDWLAHPQGGPVLRAMLAESGQDASALKPVQRFAMKRLIPMSKGRFTEELIAQLVVKAEQYDPAAAPADESAPTVPAASDAAGPTEDDDIELPDWEEKIVPGRFDGQTVIVTGAASGIGRAVASRLVREGATVVACDLSAGGLDELSAEFPGDGLTTVVADVTKADDVANVVAAAGERVDGLANVAGIMDNMTPLHEVSDEIWERVMAVNTTGLFLLTKAVLPLMLERNAGSVVNVSSEAGLRGSAAGFAYTASKHAVTGMTKSAAFMYGPSGIRVNAVAPGPVMTGIHASFDSALGAKRVRNAMALLPRTAAPEELAASIVFLLSDDGVNLNGVILPSDGGWSAA